MNRHVAVTVFVVVVEQLQQVEQTSLALSLKCCSWRRQPFYLKFFFPTLFFFRTVYKAVWAQASMRQRLGGKRVDRCICSYHWGQSGCFGNNKSVNHHAHSTPPLQLHNWLYVSEMYLYGCLNYSPSSRHSL